MTDLFIQGINIVKHLIMFVFPEVTLAPDLLLNLNKYIDLFVDVLNRVNFLVPLPDIFAIIVIIITIKVVMFGSFIINWVIRRIADFFP